MKTIKEIINDLVEFAEVNGMIGDGSIHISIGDFKVDTSVPVNADKKPEEKKLTAAEKARLRFMNMGNVEEEKDVSFEKYTEAASEEEIKKALKNIGE